MRNLKKKVPAFRLFFTFLQILFLGFLLGPRVSLAERQLCLTQLEAIFNTERPQWTQLNFSGSLVDFQLTKNVYRALRILELENAFAPVAKLISLADLFNKKDPRLKALGKFKKLEKREYSLELSKTVKKTIEVFEFQLGKGNFLQIKLPIEGDYVHVSSGPFGDTWDILLKNNFKEVEHEGRTVIALLPDLDPTQGPWVESFDEIAKDPRRFMIPTHSVQRISVSQLTSIMALLKKLGATSDMNFQLWREKTSVFEIEENLLNLRFLGARDMSPLSRVFERSKLSNEFDVEDGDKLVLRVSQSPLKIWFKNSDGKAIVFELNQNGKGLRRIYFNPTLYSVGPHKGKLKSFDGALTFWRGKPASEEGRLDLNSLSGWIHDLDITLRKAEQLNQTD
jgi:hypothetical protein